MLSPIPTLSKASNSSNAHYTICLESAFKSAVDFNRVMVGYGVAQLTELKFMYNSKF